MVSIYTCDVWFQVTMRKSVPSIISAIQMIYRVSLYYNTSERISALFIKVNILFLNCKLFIENMFYENTIWGPNFLALLKNFLGHKSNGCSMQIIHYLQRHMSNMGPKCRTHHKENAGDDDICLYGQHIWCPLLRYITCLQLWQECICLYQEYQSCFQKTKKQALERPGKRSFDVSEMQIFCKFKGFCSQLEKVQSAILFLILII